MQALCQERVTCYVYGSRHARSMTRCQHLVMASALKDHRAAGLLRQHKRRSVAVRADPRTGDSAVDRAMELARTALMDPEIQKMIAADMPKSLGNPEMLKQMMEDPDLREFVEENVDHLNSNLEKGMFDDITSRIMDQRAERYTEFDFDKLYKDMGLNRQKMLTFMQKMSSHPELCGVMDNPRVMKAIEETMMSNDEAVLEKYIGDGEVMLGLEIVLKLMEDAEENEAA